MVVLGEEDVVRFEVAMRDELIVHVLEAGNYFGSVEPSEVHRQSF